MSAPATAPVRHHAFPLKGGLDLVTPPLSLKPGVARDALNWEVSVTGGYSEILGYERFDGRPAPSEAGFDVMRLSSAVGLDVGAVIGNQAGTAVADVVALDGLLVVYTTTSGAFAEGDLVTVGSEVAGTVVELGGALSPRTTAAYRALAADHRRRAIAAVPGSGPVRGVAALGGSLYAWRDNPEATELRLWRASPGGWVRVALGFELGFASGTSAPIVGSTITGATSGASGVVARVALESGSWTGGTATGRIILSSVTSNFIGGESLRMGGVARAMATASAQAIRPQPGGRVQTVRSNFGGAQATKLYGCDGVNPGFEFDGAVYVPIRTGMSPDAPSNVLVHQNYLWFSFGPSVQFSALGQPYQWEPLLGAGEFVNPGDVTALLELPGDQSTGAMGVWWADGMAVVYGSSAANFQRVGFSGGAGALPYTAQALDQPYVFAPQGVVGLAASRNFGNFDAATLTLGIRPLVQEHRTRTSASAVNKERSQYRVFFSDGYGLYLTIANGKFAGVMPVLFAHPVLCWCDAPVQADGTEASFFGSSDGMVYRMDTGPSFDGQPIPRTLTLTFNAVGNPRVLKRWRKAAIEVAGGDYSELSIGWAIGYADAGAREQPVSRVHGTPLSNPRWDNFTWDSFTWDGRSLAPIEVGIEGSAENIALVINDAGSTFQPITINSVTLHFSPRRGMR